MRLRGVVILMAGMAVGSAEAQAPQPPEAILRAFDGMAARPLWPGYAPARMPLAIFDGRRTWLIRHPQPPPGFVQAANGWWVMEGRQEAVTANSSADIGGVKTATLMPAEGVDPTTRAATMIHECFHVYQRKEHPTWAGNEAELFTYPAVDGEVLATRWEEEADLWSALRCEEVPLAKAYARRAMATRLGRFARIGSEAAAYERGCELNEGLATCVEYRALGRKAFDAPTAPRIGAEHLRDQRVYDLGPAFAQLLDRFRPGWEAALNEGKPASLDEALRDAVSDADMTRLPPLDPSLHGAAMRAAEVALKARATAEAAYLDQPGWSLEITAASGNPLQSLRFDPWNVRSLTPGRVLHTRYLKLGNDRGELEMLDQQGLTLAAGKHPLWDGVARFTIAGLKVKPVLTRLADGKWRIQATGLDGAFAAQTRWAGKVLKIQL